MQPGLSFGPTDAVADRVGHGACCDAAASFCEEDMREEGVGGRPLGGLQVGEVAGIRTGEEQGKARRRVQGDPQAPGRHRSGHEK